MHEKVKEITKKIIQCNDLEDEYPYWDEPTLRQNFGSLLKGYKAMLIGVKSLLKKGR